MKLGAFAQSQTEALPEFIQKYQHRFPGLLFTNHNLHLENLERDVNIVAIFCYNDNAPCCNSTINISLQIPEYGSCFWDFASMLPRMSPSGDAIRITVNDRLAAVYIPKKNILYTADFTHHQRDVDTAYMVLDAICRVLPIREKAIWRSTKTKSRKISKITLGADPEFILKEFGGDMVSASEVYNSINDPIGCDGEGEQLELRPAPAESPQQVVKHIHDLLKQVANDGFEVSTDTDTYPIGGHIHVGIGKEISPSQDLLRVFDDFLGAPTQYLTYRGTYGHLSSYRTQPWGFEYRTPSAAVFAHPKMAEISLKIMKSLVEHAIQEKEIEYDDIRPSVDDYINICKLTPDEATFFIKYVGAFVPTDNVLGLWKIKPKKREFPLWLDFLDTWDIEVKTYLRERAENLSFPKSLIIRLFGLHIDRGMVCTIPVEGCKQISHPRASDECIGIARKLRMNPTLEQLENLWKAIELHVRNLCA